MGSLVLCPCLNPDYLGSDFIILSSKVCIALGNPHPVSIPASQSGEEEAEGMGIALQERHVPPPLTHPVSQMESCDHS